MTSPHLMTPYGYITRKDFDPKTPFTGFDFDTLFTCFDFDIDPKTPFTGFDFDFDPETLFTGFDFDTLFTGFDFDTITKPVQYMSFERALVYALSLNLKTKKEWEAWCKSGARPATIPSTPHAVYKHAGWHGYGHWLGTGNVGVKKDHKYMSFENAMEYVHTLKLKKVKEWKVWTKTSVRPANIPSTPDIIYKNDGWQGYGHWLGTSTVGVKKDHKFLPFQEALLYARRLKRKSQKEWHTWCKSGTRPANIPASPHNIYKNDGWQGYGHWLGTSTVGVKKDHKFLPFQEALLYVRSLNLKKNKEWVAWCKTGFRPANIPSNPHQTYQHEGWQGYGHWLGTSNLVGGKLAFLPFKKALLYARTLKLKSYKQWQDWAKTSARPTNIPSNPYATYKDEGWQCCGHWLGTGNVSSKDMQFLPFKKALLYARALKLKSHKDWQGWVKTGDRPANMPSRPDVTYKHDDWQGYGHWLGTGSVSGGQRQEFLPFKDALLHARSLNLKTRNEWEQWCKSKARPANMPTNPNRDYKHDGWQGYNHWLGTDHVTSQEKVTSNEK